MNVRIRMTAALTGVLLSLASTASALDNDPALHRLCSGFDPSVAAPCSGAPVPDQASFAELGREYGLAMAPSLLAPAETLGINGFEFGVQLGVTNIQDGKAYWQRGIEDQTPPTVLMSSRLDFRKGLPYSLELGANATYLINSEVWAFGGSVKWAPHEAVDMLPVDFAVRGSFSRSVGSPQLKITTIGLDAIISRSFGVGGVANVAPYMAYSPLFVFARSGVVDSTPGNGGDAASFVFAGEDVVAHRFTLGTRFVFGSVNFTPELALAKGVQSYSFNLGLDF